MESLSGSVFSFQPLDQPLSWGKLRNCDVKRIVHNSDVESLLRYSNEICMGSVDDSGQDASFIKAVKLSQLSAQYLAHCNDTLHAREKVVRKALKTFKSEEDALDYEIFKLRAKEESLRTEYAEYNKLHKDYINLLESLEPDVARSYKNNRYRSRASSRSMKSKGGRRVHDDSDDDYVGSNRGRVSGSGDSSEDLESKELEEKLSKIERKSGRSRRDPVRMASVVSRDHKKVNHHREERRDDEVDDGDEVADYIRNRGERHNREKLRAEHVAEDFDMAPLSATKSSLNSPINNINSTTNSNNSNKSNKSNKSNSGSPSQPIELISKHNVHINNNDNKIINSSSSNTIPSPWAEAKPSASLQLPVHSFHNTGSISHTSTAMSVDSLNMAEIKTISTSANVVDKVVGIASKGLAPVPILLPDSTNLADDMNMVTNNSSNMRPSYSSYNQAKSSTRTSLSSIPSEVSDSRNSSEYEALASHRSNLQFLEESNNSNNYDNDNSDDDHGKHINNRFKNGDSTNDYNKYGSSAAHDSYMADDDLDADDDPFNSFSNNKRGSSSKYSEIDTSMSVSIDFGSAVTSNNKDNKRFSNDGVSSLASSNTLGGTNRDADNDDVNSNSRKTASVKSNSTGSTHNNNIAESQLGKTQLVSYLQRHRESSDIDANLDGTASSIGNLELLTATSPVENEDNDDVLLGTVGYVDTGTITPSVSISNSNTLKTIPSIKSAPAIYSRNKTFFPEDEDNLAATVSATTQLKSSTVTVIPSNVSNLKVEEDVAPYSSFDSDSSLSLSANLDSKQSDQLQKPVSNNSNSNSINNNNNNNYVGGKKDTLDDSNELINNSLELEDVSDFLESSMEKKTSKSNMSTAESLTSKQLVSKDKESSTSNSSNSNSITNNANNKYAAKKHEAESNIVEWKIGRASTEYIATAKAIEVQVISVNLETHIMYEYKEFQVSLGFIESQSPLSFPPTTINQKATFQNVNYASHIICNSAADDAISSEIDREKENIHFVVNIHVQDPRSKSIIVLGRAEVNLWVMIEDAIHLVRKEVDLIGEEDGDSIGSVTVDVRGYDALLKNCH